MEKVREIEMSNNPGTQKVLPKSTRGFRPREYSCKDRDGRVLTNEEDILRRWYEHFQELLNKGEESAEERENVEYITVDQEIEGPSLVETISVVKALKNNKEPGYNHGGAAQEWRARTLELYS